MLTRKRRASQIEPSPVEVFSLVLSANSDTPYRTPEPAARPPAVRARSTPQSQARRRCVLCVPAVPPHSPAATGACRDRPPDGAGELPSWSPQCEEEQVLNILKRDLCLRRRNKMKRLRQEPKTQAAEDNTGRTPPPSNAWAKVAMGEAAGHGKGGPADRVFRHKEPSQLDGPLQRGLRAARPPKRSCTGSQAALGRAKARKTPCLTDPRAAENDSHRPGRGEA